MADISKDKKTTHEVKRKGEWQGFRLSLGAAIQGKVVDNKFIKANHVGVERIG